MNIIDAAKALQEGKIVNLGGVRLVPSVANFIDVCGWGGKNETVLEIEDLLSEKWTVVDE